MKNKQILQSNLFLAAKSLIDYTNTTDYPKPNTPEFLELINLTNILSLEIRRLENAVRMEEGESDHLKNNNNFKEVFAATFLASYTAKRYDDYCSRGLQEELSKFPVEDAEFLARGAEEQWSEYNDLG
jgi:hypothetical protein